MTERYGDASAAMTEGRQTGNEAKISNERDLQMAVQGGLTPGGNSIVGRGTKKVMGKASSFE